MKLLDLLLTNEQDMIEKIDHNSPLGKSDHSLLEFKFKCYTDRKTSKRRRFFYDKGHYEAMNDFFTDEWNANLMNQTRVDDMWKYLVEGLRKAELQCIPCKVVDSMAPRRKDNKGPLDKKTLEATRKKHRCWQRYLETRDPLKYREYTRQRNKVRAMSRKMQRDTERAIAKEAKNNPKKFWRFVKNKLRTRSGIADLQKEGEVSLASTDKEKAQILSDVFSSVYVRESTADIPEFNDRAYDRKLSEIEITPTVVLSKLNKIKIDKVPGPDGVHPRILNELKGPMSELLTLIFRQSLRDEVLPTEWKTAYVSAIF